MKKIYYILLAMLFIIASSQGLFAVVTITSVTGTNGDNIGGNRYYLASTTTGGTSYTFSITATDPNATAWTEWSNVQLTIGGIGVDFEADVTGGAGAAAVTVNSGNVTVTANAAGTFNILTVTYTVYFDWGATEYAQGIRTLTAFAESNNPTDLLTSDTDNGTTVTAGVVSSAKVIITQDGNAADGYVNPWDAAFNITGDVVYNVATATAANTIPAADITTTPELVYELDGGGDVATGLTDANTDTALDLAVSAEWFAGNGEANDGIGTYEWKVRLTLPNGLQIITSDGPLTLVCDKIQITDLQFQNGSGYDNDPDYNRNIYIHGTQVRIRAQMEYGGGTLPGGTTITVSYDYGSGAQTTDVTVAAGNNWSGWANIINPVDADVGVGTTTAFNSYQVTNVTGGSYSGGTGQNVLARITQTITETIYWDNADPPGPTAAPFTGWVSESATADSITLTWTALGGGGADDDFSAYRVYFRVNGTTSWNMVEVTNIATPTATITNLQPLTQYDYYVTAIDIFGNEVTQANSTPSFFATIQTYPASTTITISDGITSYNDDTFTSNAAPAARPLRQTAIRIEAYLVGGSTQPDQLNLILGDYALEPADILAGVYYRIAFVKSSANTWIAHIPDTNPLIATGTELRFKLEAITDSNTVYYDHDSEGEVPPGDPDDYEWTFAITTQPTFTPWPARVLNNVITDKNPRAYPAYYLSSDAYVSIRVYDIKGRVIATLMENAFRKGGQNIKEQGWSGTNKSRKKLGPGLYYIHFKAKRASDGKVILNKFKKVVIAR